MVQLAKLVFQSRYVTTELKSGSHFIVPENLKFIITKSLITEFPTFMET